MDETQLKFTLIEFNRRERDEMSSHIGFGIYLINFFAFYVRVKSSSSSCRISQCQWIISCICMLFALNICMLAYRCKGDNIHIHIMRNMCLDETDENEKNLMFRACIEALACRFKYFICARTPTPIATNLAHCR